MFRLRALAAAPLLLALPAVAVAAPTPRDAAKALIAEVQRSPAARGAARDALGSAEQALARADRARLAGDERHGAALEALALEWAQAAKDLVRAASAERRAVELERQVGAAASALDRARTLIEQTNARRNRAEAQLRELDATKGSSTPATDAAPAKPQKPAPKPAPSGKEGSE